MVRQRRRGFSQFDLLVIIAIIGFIVGFLMVAVQRAREAARRIESTNNLKQIGLAVHTYHDTENHFPPGCDKNNFSAYAHLLPYIEQNNIHAQIAFTKPVSDRANDRARMTPVKLFLSPRDLPPVAGDKPAPTNYLLNAGALPALKGNNGPFCLDSKVTLTEVTNANGTSNTVMAVETLRGDGGTKAVDVRRQHVALKLDSLTPPPAPKADAKLVAKLIAELDSEQFQVRDKATEELKKLGRGAEPALREVLKGKPSVEVKQRIDDLLSRLAPDGAINNLKEDAGVQEWKDGKNINGDRGASWLDGRFLQTTFTGTRSPNDARPDVNCEGLGGLSSPRSLDGRLIVVLFCDGHVQSIPTTVAPKMWQAMCNWKNTTVPIQLP